MEATLSRIVLPACPASSIKARMIALPKPRLRCAGTMAAVDDAQGRPRTLHDNSSDRHAVEFDNIEPRVREICTIGHRLRLKLKPHELVEGSRLQLQQSKLCRARTRKKAGSERHHPASAPAAATIGREPGLQPGLAPNRLR